VIGLLFLTSGLCGSVRSAEDKAGYAILDKAIKALGGEENLNKIKTATWKAKGKINIGFGDSESSSETTVQGLDHSRSEFAAEFGGMKNYGVSVLADDKGWRKFGDLQGPMDKDELADARRNLYLQVIPMTLVPLKDKSFELELAEEAKVEGKSTIGLKITGPDGKDFLLYFDKENGLPVKQVARVAGFMGGARLRRKRPSATTKKSVVSRRPPGSRPSATAKTFSTRKSPISRCSTRSIPRPLASRSDLPPRTALGQPRKQKLAWPATRGPGNSFSLMGGSHAPD
jgi:hypothetical protein